MQRKKSFVLLFTLLFLLPSIAYLEWDTTTPAGTESKSLGDDRIRELKTDVQSALRQQGVFPGADTANPRFMMKLSTVTTANRPTGNDVSTGTWIVNTSSNAIEQYNGTNWNAVDVVASSSIVSGDLAVSVAGSGLGGGGGEPLRLQYDSTFFSISGDSVTYIFPSNSIVQITTFTTTTSSSTNSGTYVGTALHKTITPLFSTSKILIDVVTCVTTQNITGGGSTFMSIRRNATELTGGNIMASGGVPTTSTITFPVTMLWYDSPATTNATQYEVVMLTSNSNTTGTIPGNGCTSIMRLQELKQ